MEGHTVQNTSADAETIITRPDWWPEELYVQMYLYTYYIILYH